MLWLGEQYCLGSYEAAFYYNMSSQNFSIVNTGYTKQSSGTAAHTNHSWQVA